MVRLGRQALDSKSAALGVEVAIGIRGERVRVAAATRSSHATRS